MSRFANVPLTPMPQPAQERILRGDELVAGKQYILIDTRQTKKLTPGTQFIASKLVNENGERLLVSLYDDRGSVLYSTAVDIFSVWE